VGLRQGDPVFMRRVNGWLTIFWLAMIPVSIITHWLCHCGGWYPVTGPRGKPLGLR
jgi:hypothetical protein